MAKFDLFEIKQKLDSERENKPVRETVGQKILMVAVTAIALAMIYSFLVTFGFSAGVIRGIQIVFVILVVLRAIQVFRRKL